MQINAKETKAGRIAAIERESAEHKATLERDSIERKAAIERETAELQARLDLQRLEKERELLELKNQAEQENDDDENAEAVHIKYKAIRPTIPAFNETKDDIDAYLQRYEKMAEVNKWPETDWVLHLYTLFLDWASAGTVCVLTSRRGAWL